MTMENSRDYTTMDGYIENPQLDWTVVYPIFVRRRLANEVVRWEDSLVYIASTPEKAFEWCKNNTDIERRDNPERWWWFVVNQEAIDGDYSGIKGLVQLLDWDGNPIQYDPVHGYKSDKKSQESTDESSNPASNP